MTAISTALRTAIWHERAARLGADPVFVVYHVADGTRRPHDWFESHRQAQVAAVTLVDAHVAEAPR